MARNRPIGAEESPARQRPSWTSSEWPRFLAVQSCTRALPARCPALNGSRGETDLPMAGGCLLGPGLRGARRREMHAPPSQRRPDRRRHRSEDRNRCTRHARRGLTPAECGRPRRQRSRLEARCWSASDSSESLRVSRSACAKNSNRTPSGSQSRADSNLIEHRVLHARDVTPHSFDRKLTSDLRSGGQCTNHILTSDRADNRIRICQGSFSDEIPLAEASQNDDELTADAGKNFQIKIRRQVAEGAPA